MEIEETESTLIIKNATEGILNIVPDLPWTLFYYEISLSNMLFGNKLFPLDNEFNLDDVVGIIGGLKDEHDGIEASVDLYFYKN